MLSKLTECTVVMLRVIHEMYSTQKITYKEFVDYTEMKLQFLSENIDRFSSEDEKRDASEIINKCTSVISQFDDRYLQ